MEPVATTLVPCEAGGGLALDAVQGATPMLLSWRSSASSSIVEMPVYVDRQMDNRMIEQVVVHVHGRERDAKTAYTDAFAARSLLPPEQQKRVLLVAPQFLNGLDKDRFDASQRPTLLVWKANDWGDGLPSTHRKGLVSAGVSSFESLDILVSHLTSDLYPAVRRVVLSGHSLGGQLVHRYSILGLPTPQKSGVEVVYAVMNPASFLYFTQQRAGPYAPGMNVYKYGFDQLSAHLASYIPLNPSPAANLDRFLRERRVHFLHGSADKGSGDDRPPALAQGKDRKERASNYHAHLAKMEQELAGIAERRWTVDWVQGVGHDGRAMMTSTQAIARIFHI